MGLTTLSHVSPDSAANNVINKDSQPEAASSRSRHELLEQLPMGIAGRTRAENEVMLSVKPAVYLARNGEG